jgi:hypothetical protein
VGETGEVGRALVRDEADGFTIVGEGLLDAVEPTTLPEALAAAVDAEPPFPFPEPPWTAYPFETRWFTGWDDGAQAPAPLRTAGASWNPEWAAVDQDGDAARWRVARLTDRRSG